MAIRYIDPQTIRFRREPNKRDIEYQKGLLARQGMIEPIEVDPDNYVKSDYPYAEAQIAATQALRWETVIVCDSDDPDND